LNLAARSCQQSCRQDGL